MKKFKKAIVAILVLVLVLTLFVACGDKNNKTDAPSDSQTGQGEQGGGNQGGQGEQGGGNQGEQGGGNQGGQGEQSPYFDYNLSEIFAKYAEPDEWNFKVQYDLYVYDLSVPNSSVTYGYKTGYNMSYTYTTGDEERTDYYVEYSTYYEDNGNGTYTKHDSESSDYASKVQAIESQLIFVDTLGKYEFAHFDLSADKIPSDTQEKFNQYYAKNAQELGKSVFGENAITGIEWNRVEMHLKDENIDKVVATGVVKYKENGQDASCDYKIEIKFSDFGNVDFDVEGLSLWDARTLRSQMKTWLGKNTDYDQALPLQSTGDYHCLVVPVQFSGDLFTNSELNKLEKAFNGTPAETGWHSVKSYYQTSSYGKLNMTFDIQKTFTASQKASYYESYSKNIVYGGETVSKSGADLLFEQVIAWLAPTIDLTEYDNDGNGVLDGIWMIYSTDIDYDNVDFYWAYVTQYMIADNDTKTYAGLKLGSYLFAGIDFTDEFTGNANDPYNEEFSISGLKINASTYIHETGHMLGLDDYYDYSVETGSLGGLGGADMMDNTVGDHNAYSKTMLGWIAPTIVTTSQTITIKSLESSGNCILIALDGGNSNFSEYLLIDLYSATGLNVAHANQYESSLYPTKSKTGASYGVRIYHVSSDIDNPYSDDHWSFTTNNNSNSEIALLELVRANGKSGYELLTDEYKEKYKGSGDYTDLWKAGQKLSTVFPNYARNDNKKVNFDIEIVSVSATQATVMITFAA